MRLGVGVVLAFHVGRATSWVTKAGKGGKQR